MKSSLLHHSLVVSRLLFEHLVESSITGSDEFSLLGGILFNTAHLEVFHTQTEVVGNVNLVALLFHIVFVSSDGLFALTVAAIKFSQLLVVVELRGVLSQSFFVSRDSSGEILLFLSQSSSIFVVYRNVVAVSVFRIAEVSRSFFSRFDSCIVVHSFANLVYFGKEVHTADNHIFGREGKHFSSHFNDTGKVSLRIERLEEVFARTNVEVSILGGSLVVSFVSFHSVIVLAELIVDVAEVLVSIVVAGVSSLDFFKSFDSHVGVYVFVNESVTLQSGNIGGVDCKHFVETHTCLSPLLCLHEHFAREHQTGNVSRLCLVHVVSTHAGCGIVVLFKEISTYSNKVFLIVADFLSQLHEGFVGFIGVLHAEVDNLIGHGLILGIQRRAFIASLSRCSVQAQSEEG